MLIILLPERPNRAPEAGMLKNLFPKRANRALEAEVMKNLFSERVDPARRTERREPPLARERQAHLGRK